MPRPVEVAAFAAKRADGRYFVARRRGPFYADCWEFPGGKVEPGESLPDAVVREMNEELSTGVFLEAQVARIVIPVRPPQTGRAAINLFRGTFSLPPLVGVAHTAGAWLTPAEIRSIPAQYQTPSLLPALDALEASPAV